MTACAAAGCDTAPEPGHARWASDPLALLNTSILTADGTFTMTTVSTDFVVIAARSRGVTSYIGHAATAELISTILGVAVPVNRVPFEQQIDQEALVFKLNGRSAEGRILARADLEDIGFTWKLLRRIS